jgi:hypothetical protein
MSFSQVAAIMLTALSEVKVECIGLSLYQAHAYVETAHKYTFEKIHCNQEQPKPSHIYARQVQTPARVGRATIRKIQAAGAVHLPSTSRRTKAAPPSETDDVDTESQYNAVQCTQGASQIYYMVAFKDAVLTLHTCAAPADRPTDE